MAGLEGKILDRYEVRKLIGRGGMADVYEGYDPRFERVVAIKVFKRDDEEMLRRFIQEAHLMARLSNPRLVSIYDSGESQVDGLPWYYIIMPLIEGGTLRARIRRSPLPLAEACHDLQDIAEALDYIHRQGIVHRDIKASNVLLDTAGSCYLTDFGIARTMTDMTQLTSTGNVLGTVDYIAPELFEPDRRANARSDLYSLGVLLFEMVTGQLPFHGENQLAVVSMHVNKRPPSPRSISQKISGQVERVILKALEKRPEQRYNSATELAEAFCRAVGATNKNATGVSKRERGSATHIAPLVGVAADADVQPQTLGTPDPSPALSTSSPLTDAAETLPSADVSPLVDLPTQAQVKRAPLILPPLSMLPTIPAIPAVPMPPNTPPPPSRRNVWLFAIVGVVLLLLITVPILVAVLPRSGGTTVTTTTTTAQAQNSATVGASTSIATQAPTATPNLTATAQTTAASATATAQRATGTAVAQATGTAQAQASATPGVLQTATAGTPTYHDMLNDATHSATQAANWDQNGHCGFQPDGYHVTESINLVNFHGCREQNNPYQNATLTVDVNLLSGHSSGLFFRLSTDGLNNYSAYLFEVDTTGRYKLSIVTGGTVNLWQDWTDSSALKQGNNVKNTLQVIMQNTDFYFYANGLFLTHQTDSTYSSAGTMGFLATTVLGGSGADVVYSNLNVYPLP